MESAEKKWRENHRKYFTSLNKPELESAIVDVDERFRAEERGGKETHS